MRTESLRERATGSAVQGGAGGARRRRPLPLVLALAALLAIPVFASQANLAAGDRVAAAKKKPMDFGDAPDGEKGELDSKPKVKADYPSLLKSDGARHEVIDKLKLGRRVDSEKDSNQVDRDIGDDGFGALLDACEKSEFRFAVDARGLPESVLRKRTAYLNSWFDWKKDGDWQDERKCQGRGRNEGSRRGELSGGGQSVPEWVVRNHELKLKSFIKDPLQEIVVKEKAGGVGPDLWYRASVTLEKFKERIQVPGEEGRRPNDGRGSFRFGETEDGRYEGTDPDTAACLPDYQRVTHDVGQVNGTFVINNQQPAGVSLDPSSVIPNPPSGAQYTPQFGPNGWTMNVPEDPPAGFDFIDLYFNLVAANGKGATVVCLIDTEHFEGGDGDGDEDGPQDDPIPEGGDETGGGGTGGGDTGGGTGGGGTGGGGTTTGEKTVGPFPGGDPTFPDCNPGFFIDIYIDADAVNPTHEILGNNPPCENATITPTVFEAGVEPPDTPEGEERWKTHKTYRVIIQGGSGQPESFRVKVTWQKP